MAIVLLALMAVLAVIIYAVVKIRCDLDNLNQERVDGGMERVKRNSRGFETNILPGLLVQICFLILNFNAKLATVENLAKKFR